MVQLNTIVIFCDCQTSKCMTHDIRNDSIYVEENYYLFISDHVIGSKNKNKKLFVQKVINV